MNKKLIPFQFTCNSYLHCKSCPKHLDCNQLYECFCVGLWVGVFKIFRTEGNFYFFLYSLGQAFSLASVGLCVSLRSLRFFLTFFAVEMFTARVAKYYAKDARLFACVPYGRNLTARSAKFYAMAAILFFCVPCDSSLCSLRLNF